MKNDLIGKCFGKWSVISYEGTHKKSRDALWKCKCVCGRFSITKGYYFTNGYSTQCKYCGMHKRSPYPSNNIPNPIWKRIINNAKKRNIEFKITKSEAYEKFLAQNKKCKLSGLPLSFPLHGTDLINNGCIASLDRIDSNMSYTYNNIQWVHKDINLMKNALSELRFMELCKLIVGNKINYEN